MLNGAAGLIVIDVIAAGRLQGGLSQAQVLILGGDSGIADAHG